MAEATGGEKTLPATPRKIQKARDRGNVARSQDLSAAVTLTVALLGMWMFGPASARQLLAVMAYYFSEAHTLLPGPGNIQPILAQALLLSIPIAIPLMLLLMAAGILINITQVGFLVAPEALKPKPERLNPIQGFQRFVSMRSFVELIKSLSKLGIVGWIAWVTVQGFIVEIVATMNLSPGAAAVAVWNMMLVVWFRIVLAMIAIGILDFAFQRFQHGRDLMMTFQEARDEMKEMEGDPRIKQRVRQIQRQMAMQRMMADVPEADVVITNPTAFAVALRYDTASMMAPVVVAKGARRTAERIREIAIEHGVPIVQRPELARTIFQTIEVGQPVPDHLFRAVAEVLAFVYEIDQREDKVRERTQMPTMAQAI